MPNNYNPEVVRTGVIDAVAAYFSRDNFPAGMFSTDISEAWMKDRDIIQAILRKGAGKPVFSAKKWTNTDLSRGAREVRMYRITRSASFLPEETENGAERQKTIDELLESVRMGVDLLLERSLKGAPRLNIGSRDTFSHRVLNDLVWEKIRQPGSAPSVFLKTDYVSKLLPGNRDDLGIVDSSTWNKIGVYNNAGAAKNFVGVAANRNAFLLANRLPFEAKIDLGFTTQEIITAPDVGLKFLYTEWASQDTRELRCSIDTLIGIERAADFNSLVLTNNEEPFIPDLLENIDDMQEAA